MYKSIIPNDAMHIVIETYRRDLILQQPTLARVNINVVLVALIT